MKKILAAALAASLFAAAPAIAREGAQSVGKAIKCYQTVQQQPDGSFRVVQVCYKGV